MGLRRFATHVRVLLAAASSPHQIALGVSLGLSLSLVPIPVLGMVAALAAAPLLRANLLATYAGSMIVNPVTGPFIYFAELWVGLTVTRQPVPAWSELARYTGWEWLALMETMLGPFVIGVAVFTGASVVVSYPAVYAAARRVQRRRGAPITAPE